MSIVKEPFITEESINQKEQYILTGVFNDSTRATRTSDVKGEISNYSIEATFKFLCDVNLLRTYDGLLGKDFLKIDYRYKLVIKFKNEIYTIHKMWKTWFF